ncbi:hypothetical protein D3C86_1909280 [compost metagenome]
MDLEFQQVEVLGLGDTIAAKVGIAVVDFVQHEIQPALFVDQPEVENHLGEQRQVHITVEMLRHVIALGDDPLPAGPGLDHLLHPPCLRRIDGVLAGRGDDPHHEVQRLEDQRAHPGVVDDRRVGQQGD